MSCFTFRYRLQNFVFFLWFLDEAGFLPTKSRDVTLKLIVSSASENQLWFLCLQQNIAWWIQYTSYLDVTSVLACVVMLVWLLSSMHIAHSAARLHYQHKHFRSTGCWSHSNFFFLKSTGCWSHLKTNILSQQYVGLTQKQTFLVSLKNKHFKTTVCWSRSKTNILRQQYVGLAQKQTF